MRITLITKNKFGFADGTIPQSDPDVDPSLVTAWLCNNNIVCSLLLNLIVKDITASAIQLSSAAVIWIDLQERFQQQNGLRIFQLKKDLELFSQGNLTVSQYFTKLKGLWEGIG